MVELFAAVLAGALCMLIGWAVLTALARLQPACAPLALSPLTQKAVLLLACLVTVTAFGQLAPKPSIPAPAPEAIASPVLTPSVEDQPTPVNVLVSALTDTRPPLGAPRGLPQAALAIDLRAFPRPPGDNGRGLHWFPTTAQTKAVVDTFVPELVVMRIKWVPFVQGLEDYDLTANDYLVQRLIQSQIMPVMRVEARIGALDPGRFRRVVERYTARGVRYIQIYNEPNLKDEWVDGKVGTPAQFASLWLETAQVVVTANAFPGLAALSPNGDMADTDYLRGTLAALTRKGREDVLARTWLAVHNYASGPPGADVRDETGYGRYRGYASISRTVLGTVPPMIGTEGGAVQAAEESQTRWLLQAFQSLRTRESYWLAFSPWLIGNAVGGGTDARWEGAAWFKADRVEPVVGALKLLP